MPINKNITFPTGPVPGYTPGYDVAFRNPDDPTSGYYVGISNYDQPEPSYVDTLTAWMQSENLIGSAISQAYTNVENEWNTKIDPSYDPFSDIKGYEEYLERFESVFNAQQASALKANIDRERRNSTTMAQSGWVPWTVGLLSANLLDPTILIPGGAAVRSGKIGFSAMKTSTTAAKAAAAVELFQETGLHATQETRTLEDSAMNIGGSVILGGLIGAAAGKLFDRMEWSRVTKALDDNLAGEVADPREITDIIVSRMKDANSAAVDKLKLDDLGVGGPMIAQVVAKATAAARINPGLETMFSPSKQARRVYAELVDNPVYMRMHMEGKTLGADVENLVKFYRGAEADWLASSRRLYRDARRSGYLGSRADFYRDIAFAGRRGDIDPKGNEFVTRAAQEARGKIFNPLLKEAQEVGILPVDVKTTTAASYVSRLWNRARLIGEEDRFRQIARQYFEGQLSTIEAMQKAGKDAPKTPDFLSDIERKDYIEDVITEVFNNLTGRGKGDVPEWIVPISRGPLKERTFNIPDRMVEDFLENDMEMIIRRHSRVMGAEVELSRKFGRADMKEQFDAINREYDDLSRSAKTSKERIALDKARRRDLVNLAAFRDIVRGTYRASDESSAWTRLTRAALTWNYIRLMGGILLTSLTDASNIIGKHGMQATMREALPALVSGVEAAKISRADAKTLGVVVDVALQSRLADLAELADPYARGSRFERFMSNVSNTFTKATGLGWWNDYVRTVASVMTQNRILSNIMASVEDVIYEPVTKAGTSETLPKTISAVNLEKISSAERAYLAHLGIDGTAAQRIAEQFKKYGVKDQGIHGANVSKWDDPVAVRAFGAALHKHVDTTVIQKGSADNPLWMKSNWGKILMQFKSFALASHQRILISGLQSHQHRLAEMMVFGTAVGMLISYVKMIERGDTEEANRLLQNPGLWVANGLDRSGILAIPFEVSNTFEKLGVPFGMALAQKLAGDPDRRGGATRYASRGKFGAVAGPTVGTFEDIAIIASQLAKGDLEKDGARALINQIPGGTLPGIRTGLNAVVKPAVVDAVE